MSNTFNISVKPEIAAVSALVIDNQTEIATIRVTDLPALDTKIITLDTVADNIRNIDVPNIQTNIDANETKIDTIDGIVDAIKLKTDLLPQSFRGDFHTDYITTESATFVAVVNLTGSGILYALNLRLANAADTVELRVTIDGILLSVLSHTGDILDWHVQVIGSGGTMTLSSAKSGGNDWNNLNFEYSTSLKVEARRSAGTASHVVAALNYSIDTF